MGEQTNEDELADVFFAEFPVDFEIIPDRKLSLGKIRDRTREHFLDYIHRIKSEDIPEDSGDHLFCRNRVIARVKQFVLAMNRERDSLL